VSRWADWLFGRVDLRPTVPPRPVPPRLTSSEVTLRGQIARLEGEVTVLRAERDLAVAHAQGWQRRHDALSGALVEARRSVCVHDRDTVPRAQAVALAAEVERLRRMVEIPRVTP